MNAVDPTIVRTVIVVAGFLYVLCPLVAWALLVGQRNQQVALWCGGGLMVALGAFAFASKGVLPDVVALVGSNLLVMAANLMRIQSLRLDMGRPWRISGMAGFVLAMGLLISVIHYGLDNSLLRATVASVVHVLMLGYLSHLAWRIAVKEESRSAIWLSGVYAMLTFGALFRLLLILGQPDKDPSMIAGGMGTLILMTIVITAAVVGHFGYVGLVLDRVRRREVELTAARVRDEERRQLGQQIAHLDRQRSLGELSSSLAHEINQPLGAIVTHVHVGKRGIETGQLGMDKLSSVLEKIGASAMRASQIIDRIRGYIKPSDTAMQAVNLVVVIESVVALVEHELKKSGVGLELKAPSEGVWVNGDPIALSQIILNGLRNAREALENTSQPVIRIRCFKRPGKVFVHIADNGPGLNKEQLAHVGEPFFTTKSDGLGVGFSISRTIAQQHGGSLVLTNLTNAADTSAVFGAVLILTLPEGPIAETQP